MSAYIPSFGYVYVCTFTLEMYVFSSSNLDMSAFIYLHSGYIWVYTFIIDVCAYTFIMNMSAYIPPFSLCLYLYLHYRHVRIYTFNIEIDVFLFIPSFRRCLHLYVAVRIHFGSASCSDSIQPRCNPTTVSSQYNNCETRLHDIILILWNFCNAWSKYPNC